MLCKQRWPSTKVNHMQYLGQRRNSQDEINYTVNSVYVNIMIKFYPKPSIRHFTHGSLFQIILSIHSVFTRYFSDSVPTKTGEKELNMFIL